MNDNNIEEEDAPLSMAILYDVSLIVVHALCAYPHVLKWGVNCNDVTKLGAFGDMFGPLNPLVSAFAFIALVFSLCIQQHQLKLQRKDLRYQRVELGLQRGEMVKQREVSEAQTKQFESQVNLEKTAQTTDELYRRLSIVIQLGESITFSYTHNSGILPSERVEERGARAVRSMHIRPWNVCMVWMEVKHPWNEIEIIFSIVMKTWLVGTALSWKQSDLCLIGLMKSRERLMFKQ